MTHLTVEQVREAFTDTIHCFQPEGERILVRDGGEDVAVLFSVEDLELLEQLEEQLDLQKAVKAVNDPTDEVVN